MPLCTQCLTSLLEVRILPGSPLFHLFHLFLIVCLPCVCFCLFRTSSPALCLYVCLCLCLCVSLSLSVCICVSLCVSLSLCICVSLCVSLSLSLCVPQSAASSTNLCPSICVPQSTSRCPNLRSPPRFLASVWHSSLTLGMSNDPQVVNDPQAVPSNSWFPRGLELAHAIESALETTGVGPIFRRDGSDGVDFLSWGDCPMTLCNLRQQSPEARRVRLKLHSPGEYACILTPRRFERKCRGLQGGSAGWLDYFGCALFFEGTLFWDVSRAKPKQHRHDDYDMANHGTFRTWLNCGRPVFCLTRAIAIVCKLYLSVEYAP